MTKVRKIKKNKNNTENFPLECIMGFVSERNVTFFSITMNSVCINCLCMKIPCMWNFFSLMCLQSTKPMNLKLSWNNGNSWNNSWKLARILTFFSPNQPSSFLQSLSSAIFRWVSTCISTSNKLGIWKDTNLLYFLFHPYKLGNDIIGEEKKLTWIISPSLCLSLSTICVEVADLTYLLGLL